MSEKLIEEGYFTVGSNKLIHEGGNKYSIANSSGIKSYDWVTGDNPEDLESDRCNMFSHGLLKLSKITAESDLKKSFSNTLYLLSDTGSDANKLSKHFFNGGGDIFVFDSNSNLSKEIKESDEYASFKKDLLEKLKSEIADGSVRKKKKNGTYEMLNITSVKLPSYGISDAFFKNDDAATFIGGSQYCIVQYKLYKNEKMYTLKTAKVFIYDTFGAGWDDGCNTKKSYADGLRSMFVLQHYKNIGNNKKYQPFAICVEINN